MWCTFKSKAAFPRQCAALAEELAEREHDAYVLWDQIKHLWRRLDVLEEKVAKLERGVGHPHNRITPEEEIRGLRQAILLCAERVLPVGPPGAYEMDPAELLEKIVEFARTSDFLEWQAQLQNPSV